MPLSRFPSDDPAQSDGAELVVEYLAFCANSTEISSIDLERGALVACSMNDRERRQVVVIVDAEAMNSMGREVEGFSLFAIRADLAYRNDYWGALFQDMMENVETMGQRFRTIRMTSGGPYERVHPREDNR